MGFPRLVSTGMPGQMPALLMTKKRSLYNVHNNVSYLAPVLHFTINKIDIINKTKERHMDMLNLTLVNCNDEELLSYVRDF